MERFQEPLKRTLLRTVGLAVVAGAFLAWRMGGAQRFVVAFLVVLWFTFGGHWVEIFYLNWLRGRLPDSRAVRMVARVIVWFVGGVLLGVGAALTATHLGDYPVSRVPPIWLAGLGFVALELLVHVFMWRRGTGSLYRDRQS